MIQPLSRCAALCAAMFWSVPLPAQDGAPRALEIHNIFSSHMVLQRDKPIVIWGWAAPGRQVTARFGDARAETEAAAQTGRWQVTFPARPADATGRRLTIQAGSESVELEDVLVGDVWVMNGQSNMAWGLQKTVHGDLEAATAHLPLLRHIDIKPNESRTLQQQLPKSKTDGWTPCTPRTAGAFSAIGYSFASRLQRALQIPIGIIDNARGGASIESLVPLHKFDDDPVAAAYKAHLDQRIAAFDPAAVIEKKWRNQVERARRRGVPDDKLPKKPGIESLRSWDIPGASPSDAGSCYNGMFGVFKGLGIKGVVFHQGYNNAMGTNCRPQRYRVLVRLMVEGWREDFGDPKLPVGIIGFCAGSVAQTRDNFEVWTSSPAAYIREAQRLGLADLQEPAHTAFLPAYDVQIPGLHPHKKRAHGERAARWALREIYDLKVNWQRARLLSAEPNGNRITLTFDTPVYPDDKSVTLEGFSIADASGAFYMAYAENQITKYQGIWGNKCDYRKVHVWSPLVQQPVAVRYAWARNPMGNLKVNGKDYLPLHSFRTDSWDWPEAGPDTDAVSRAASRKLAEECAARLARRQDEEAKRAVELLQARRQREAELAKRDGWRK